MIKEAEVMALTIQERLKDLRIERGFTLEQLAEETGLSKSSLGNYESNDFKEISSQAIIKLAGAYKVTTDYLLGLTEKKSDTEVYVTDLNLTDEVIEILKNNQIDTALFCELVSHKDFIKLLADIQIYVEGIAVMQIENLNTWVDTSRDEIIKKYKPETYDKNLYLLKAAHIQEKEYFTQRIYRDIDFFVDDLKENHKGRSDSAPKNSTVNEIKKDLEEALNFKGSRTEQMLIVFCKQMKIKYDKLTEKEKKTLIDVASKSKLIKSYIPQRGQKKK